MSPDDLLITGRGEVAIRQELTLVALGKTPADRVLRVGRLLDVHTRSWLDRPGDRHQGPPHRLGRPRRQLARRSR